MSDNQFSKETIEKYRKELLELAKKSSIPVNPVEDVYQKKSIPFPEVPIFKKNAEEPTRQVWTENPTHASPQATTPPPNDSYREDIDEYLEEKKKAEAKRPETDDQYDNDAYIEDIDSYLRQKEELARSAVEKPSSVQEDLREELGRQLVEQAELWKQAARMPHPQQTSRESDIFINTLGWQAQPVAEIVSENINLSAEISKQEDSFQNKFVWPSFPAFQSESGYTGKSHLDFEIRQEEATTQEADSVATAMLRPHYQPEADIILPSGTSLPSEEKTNKEPLASSDELPPTKLPEENLRFGSPLPDAPTVPTPNPSEDINKGVSAPMVTDGLSESGYLWVEATMGNGGAVPVSDATVVISRSQNDSTVFCFKSVTNENGEIPRIELAAPPRDRSMKPSSDIPYQTYSVDVYKDGFYVSNTTGVQIFSGVDSFLPIKLYPVPENTIQTEEEIFVAIPPNDLLGS